MLDHYSSLQLYSVIFYFILIYIAVFFFFNIYKSGILEAETGWYTLYVAVKEEYKIFVKLCFVSLHQLLYISWSWNVLYHSQIMYCLRYDRRHRLW